MLASALHVHERRRLDVPGKVVHAISTTAFGAEAHTRCGLVACILNANTALTYYSLVTERGNSIVGTSRESLVTCKKCGNSRDLWPPVNQRKNNPARAVDLRCSACKSED